MRYQNYAAWQKYQADLVNDEIEVLFAPLSDATGFCDIIKEPLASIRQKKTTEARSRKSWYLLPLAIGESISGHYEQVIPAAAVTQLFIAAGEVFDDIEDADNPNSIAARHGSAVATNVATALLILAERAIARLKGKGVADCIIVRIMDVVNSFYTTACAGQHLDLSGAINTNISEDTYLRIAAMKSASTIECACHIGAMTATENQDLIRLSALFGQNLGMASQIANDIQGITNEHDIAARKITLPVVYALSHTKGEANNQLELAFSRNPESKLDIEQAKNLLFDSGAIYYAMIKMELYKQRALDILREFEKRGLNTNNLRLYLE